VKTSAAQAHDVCQQAPPVYARGWRNLSKTVLPTIHFLLETEAHVYAFSIAANVLLSFFPFLLTMILICRSVLHWQTGVQTILFAVNDYFPAYHDGAYLDIAGWLMKVTSRHKGISILSILMLLLTANGIFEPLEVALNRAWRVHKNRSYFMNQMVSLGLIFICGALVLLSTTLTAWNRQLLASWLGANIVTEFMRDFVFKVVALPVLMCMIFLVYWLLPNRKIPASRLIPVSVIVGILLEVMKYVNLATWPWLQAKLKNEVGPFVHSISVVIWAFCAALIVLAGAEWSAPVTLQSELTPETPYNRVP
jgi:uncharacterized BrkB/YihY/UPF0761 family membrane protein